MKNCLQLPVRNEGGNDQSGRPVGGWSQYLENKYFLTMCPPEWINSTLQVNSINAEQACAMVRWFLWGDTEIRAKWWPQVPRSDSLRAQNCLRYRLKSDIPLLSAEPLFIGQLMEEHLVRCRLCLQIFWLSQCSVSSMNFEIIGKNPHPEMADFICWQLARGGNQTTPHHIIELGS